MSGVSITAKKKEDASVATGADVEVTVDGTLVRGVRSVLIHVEANSAVSAVLHVYPEYVNFEELGAGNLIVEQYYIHDDTWMADELWP